MPALQTIFWLDAILWDTNLRTLTNPGRSPKNRKLRIPHAKIRNNQLKIPTNQVRLTVNVFSARRSDIWSQGIGAFGSATNPVLRQRHGITLIRTWEYTLPQRDRSCVVATTRHLSRRISYTIRQFSRQTPRYFRIPDSWCLHSDSHSQMTLFGPPLRVYTNSDASVTRPTLEEFSKSSWHGRRHPWRHSFWLSATFTASAYPPLRHSHVP